MSHKHVIQTDQIPFLPLESNCVTLIDLANMVHHFVLNRGSIAVVNVARQIFTLEDRKQGLAHVGIETVHMV